MAGSRWVRLDVDYFTNPKTLAAGRNGRALHLASICWTARYLTDGHIPPQALTPIGTDAGIVGSGVRHEVVDQLVGAGLWVPNGDDGWIVHDFVEMNGTRADIEKERERWRENQRRSRSRRSQ